MSNPFSVLEENFSPKKIQKKKPAKKKADKKKDVKKTNVEAPKPLNAQKRKPKRLIPEEGGAKNTEGEQPKVEEKKTAPVKRDRNFDGPTNLKNYKRDGNKGYFNRKPGQPQKKGGKRYEAKDRSVNRTGMKFQRYGPKNGEGGKFNWKGKIEKPSRYSKKNRPQEMNDEEWEKQIKDDEKKQKKEALKGKKKKVVRKVDKKKPENKDQKNGDENKDDNKKKGKKFDDKKKRPRKDFKKKPFKKDREEEEIVQPEEDESDDEGKETYEEFIKARKKPVTLNDQTERKAGEGVKILQQKDFGKTLSKGGQGYMKLKKKKTAKQSTKDDSSPKPKTKKKKKKQLSTSDFFKGSEVKKAGNKKGGFKKNSNKKGRKNVPDFKDSQSFPSLS